MTGRFRRRGNRCVARFDAPETELLRESMRSMVVLMDPDLEPADDADPLLRGGPNHPRNRPLDADDPLAALERELADPPLPPEDEVLMRLLPDAYTDDDEASAEMRRLTEWSLRAGKADAARQVLSDLPDGAGSVSIDRPAAELWLTAINDVRLFRGTMLEVTDDLDLSTAVAAEPDPERAGELICYAWLGWLQETLVETVLRTPRPDPSR